MTNLEAKQEAIKKAYGKYWDELKDYIDDKGWFNMFQYLLKINKYRNFAGIEWKRKCDCVDNELVRPESIYRIELNNGWIRIENKDYLPKKDGLYFVFTKEKEVITAYYDNTNRFCFTDWENFTHYRPIVKPLKPLY